MADRSKLVDFVLEAIPSTDQPLSWAQCAKLIWEKREAELRESGDVFYTWQYDIRWAMQKLRDEGRVANVARGKWARKN